LSQAHFGKVFIDPSEYSIDHLHFAPRAVMNAVYWDTLRELQGSDVAGTLQRLGFVAGEVGTLSRGIRVGRLGPDEE